MKIKLKLVKPAALLVLLSTLNSPLSTAQAQTTTFSYQGELTIAGTPANAPYDFEFTLYDATGPLAQSPKPGIQVTDGSFTVLLDFGSAPFSGQDCWLEIAVRPAGIGTYSTLIPRQQILPVPYALFAYSAGSLSGALPPGQFSGTYPGEVTLNNPANSFAGSGGGLTGLNASSLSTGTLADVRLSANVALRTGGNTFSGTQTFDGALALNSTGGFSQSALGNFNIDAPFIPGGRFTVLPDGNVGIGTNNPQQQLSVAAGMNIDQNNGNTGTVANTLTFGSLSGEAVGSQRSGGGNLFGLDFYTRSANRLSISNNGDVAITSGNLSWGSSQLLTDQGGAIELGDSSSTSDTPYLDFHRGVGADQDFNVRLINDIDNTLSVFAANNPRPMLRLNNSGASVQSLTITGGADLAEPFEMSAPTGEVTDGAVVVIDQEHPGRLKVSDRPYDTRVAGVLSGANGVHPGIQMQQSGIFEGTKNVALSGRVYVQADSSNGPIKPGDLLTTSSQPGRAMKVSDATRAQGAILGKAMSGLKEDQGLVRGLVLVLVTLQ